MERNQSRKPVESRDNSKASPPRPEKRTRRFRILKLEERIAPGSNGKQHYSHGIHFCA
jgi:hypothetical protein